MFFALDAFQRVLKTEQLLFFSAMRSYISCFSNFDPSALFRRNIIFLVTYRDFFLLFCHKLLRIQTFPWRNLVFCQFDRNRFVFLLLAFGKVSLELQPIKSHIFRAVNMTIEKDIELSQIIVLMWRNERICFVFMVIFNIIADKYSHFFNILLVNILIKADLIILQDVWDLPTFLSFLFEFFLLYLCF